MLYAERMKTLVLLAFGFCLAAPASTLFDYDERALHLVDALGKCPVEFQTAVRNGGSVSHGDFAAPRPADPNVYRETHTLKFAKGGTLRITATTRHGNPATYDCVLE